MLTVSLLPQGMGLAILRGAVQFGLDPGVVTVRRSRLTYGVGVLNRFQHGMHPPDKRVVAAGAEWCADVLDRFVAVDESVAVGDVVVRSYTPATPAQSTVILHLYATERHDAKVESLAFLFHSTFLCPRVPLLSFLGLSIIHPRCDVIRLSSARHPSPVPCGILILCHSCITCCATCI